MEIEMIITQISDHISIKIQVDERVRVRMREEEDVQLFV